MAWADNGGVLAEQRMGGELSGGAGAVLSPLATIHLLDSADILGSRRMLSDVLPLAMFTSWQTPPLG